jgi:hypothetical protein
LNITCLNAPKLAGSSGQDCAAKRGGLVFAPSEFYLR